MSNISLNFTAEDLSSSEGSYSVIPAGSYNATIYDIKQETVKSGPNEGKPRFNIQFRISDGANENRRVFGYVALYKAGDYWKTQAFFKALGYDLTAGSFTVPTPQELSGKPIGVRVKVGKDQDGNDRNEVSGFDAATASAGVAALLSSMGATPVTSGDVW
jgi:Protein of unknown function (DUF669)